MKAKRRIARLLSFLMVFSLMMETSNMQVFANSGMVGFAAETNIEESDYVQDEYGVFEYHAVNGTAYGTITVPEGYVFLVDNEVNVTADAIYLASGAQLTISGTGTLTCSTITASDGATMFLESNANIPSGVTVYDGENNITGDTAWEWFTFIYDNGTWYANTEPPFETHYDFCINGLEDDDTYTVEYSYDGTNYSAEGVGIDENENRNCWVDIQGIPEEWNNKLYFRVVLNLGDGDSKELLEYGFGWNGESYTIGMDYPEAGEDGLNVVKQPYQLTFAYPDVSDYLYPHDIHLQVGVPGEEEDPEEPEEPLFEEHYDFCINGLEDDDTYTVEYSYDGTNYSAEGVGIDENENRNCWVDIQGIPEEWNNKLYFRVVLNLGDGDSKELLEYGFGWNGESYTIGMDYPEAGEDGLNVVKDTYQLTFAYPDVSDYLYPHDIHLQVGVPGEEKPPFEEHYDFCINGLEDGDTYTVEYSYDGNTYVADGVGSENGNCWVDIQEIPEEWNNKLYFRVVLNLGDGDSKELLEYGFGWNGESYTIGMDNPEAGEDGLNVVKDTYQLTFYYPDVLEGLYPHDIHLQVGVPEDPEEPEETETTVTFRVENYDNADGSHNATGTVYYKFNTDENFTSVTAANMIDGTFSPAIPEGATTVTVKAVADTGSEVNKYNIDFPVSNSGNFINEENVDEIHAALTGDGYVFDLSNGSPEFCIRFTQEGAKHYILWNTLSWGGGNVTLENGTVECKKIIFDGETYTTDSSEVGGNIHSISEITNNWNTAISYKILEGDTIGYDIFVLPYSPEVVVEFELMPAKGYQIASIPSGAMDDQISEENDIIGEFEPQASSATYQYTFDGSRNIHYVPTFSEGTNTAKVTGSSVTSADVATGNNNIAGNLGLSVAEITESNASSPIKEAVAGADAVYLNIDLNQIISKGAGRGEWETSLTKLENEVTISLDVAGYDSNKSYYIVREHDGTCDRLEATYNTTTGKLEFATDRFSTYAIICTDAQTPGGGENPGENVASYSVDFGTGSWIVGDVTVTADKSGEQTLSESDIITLTGFDAETMEVRVVAEDGFSTTLAVNNNQTSISAKTNDGGVPTDIAFSVVEKSSEPGGGEVNNGNAVHANVTVNISGEELEYDAPWTNDAADFVFGINGSEMRRLSKEEVNYTTEGDKIVGLATKEALGYEYNYDDSGNVTFNIKTQWDDVITSLTINGVSYDTPQTKDDLINAFDADFRGIRFDIENVPYAEEYHIVVEGRKQTQEEKIMGNFGWTYDPNSNEYSDDDKIPYGNLEFVDAKYNGVTYNSIEEVNEAGGTFQWDDGVKGTDDPTGEAMFPTGTELTLRLIPDAGYQLTSLDLNGTPFEPGEEVGLYTFTIGGGNWHLGAQFTQVGAEVQASSVNIKSGNIDINENFEYGTAKLEVSDVASMDSSRMEEFENTATDEGYEIENYLDISLYNAVYKGGIKDVNGNYESWDTSVENIENKATITLELENDMSGKDLAVIHELHNGEEIIGYELINATYNEENNTITFETDSFSHYAIVSKGIGEDENVYHIDLGTGSWTVGDVTVSAPEGMSGVVSMLDTETIPTEMLANFDPETMDITLTAGDGFVIYLEIDENGNTTLASTRDGVELPPYGETLTFAVVAKPGNTGGGNPGGDSGNGSGNGSDSGNGSGSDSSNSNDSDNNDNSGTGGNGSSDQDSNDATQSYLPTGALFEVNGAKYKVTEADTKTRTFSVSFVKVLSKKVKTFKVPTSVTYNGVSYQVVSIGKKAFMGCKKLKKISIGSNVKTINDKAFYSCSVLKSITIPSSVTKIGKEAFAKCKKLSSIKIKSNKLTAGKIGKNAFKGIKSNATFKVPKKKMKAYKAMLKKKGVGKKAKFKKL